jgi:hypothetical protein
MASVRAPNVRDGAFTATLTLAHQRLTGGTFFCHFFGEIWFLHSST